MQTPLLYRQLQTQLRQWVTPKDQRHLQGFSEIVAAMLQSQSACLGHWIPYLTHRSCQARAHMERLSYFVHNPHITAERFYEPMLRAALEAWTGASMLLTLDSSLLWDQFCLIEICLVWGGRSFTLAQTVLEHGSAAVGFDQYRPLLETTQRNLPDDVQVTLLADRGFEHEALIRWLQARQWDWAIRVKRNLSITLANGWVRSVEQLQPSPEQAHLYENVQVLGAIPCHLAVAHVASANETWAVLSSQPPSLQTFALYGQRFGGIEPHFKDYKSAAFDILDSGLRHPEALSRLIMVLDCAILIALIIGLMVVRAGRRLQLDWHQERGLSFLQLGVRELKRLGYQGLTLPRLGRLSQHSPPPAYASKRKRDEIECRVEFAKVFRFS
jgi:hypothetical protein